MKRSVEKKQAAVMRRVRRRWMRKMNPEMTKRTVTCGMMRTKGARAMTRVSNEIL
jgi:hypothetical protein